MTFYINSIFWNIKFVPFNSANLKRSDGTAALGVTDWNDKCVYLSDALHDDFLERVICHELTHCICFSWNISIPIETEEWLCNFMTDHGKEVIYLLNDLLRGMSKRIA